MTTYYVDYVNGLDANNGLGPDASHATNKPWKTLAKLLGAAGFASGDTAYLSPAGPFREVVTVAMTSAVAETKVFGDPGNAQGFKTAAGVLVAPAEVVWTAYTTNDTTAPSASILLTLAGRDFLTFQYITFMGGGGSPSIIGAATTNSINITIRDCKLISGNISTAAISYIGLADIAANWTIDRCRFLCFAGNAIVATFPTSAGADFDTNFQIHNCEFNVAGGTAINIIASGAASFKPGGVDVIDCVFCTRLSAMTASANIATTIPCTMTNSLLLCAAGPALSAATLGQIIENYNRIVSTTLRTNVDIGANSIDGFTHALLLDLGFAEQLGFARRPYFSPMPLSPLLGFGSSGAPLVDILNRPRPAGGAAITKAVGAYERHNTAIRETTTVRTGSSALAIVGPGDHDFQVPVDASSTTVSVYMRYDATHDATNKPQMQVVNGEECGVTAATATMTAAADTWEQLSLTFTPTRAGIVTVRLISRAAAGGGKAFADDFSVA